MYFKLSIRNVKRSFSDYLLYLVTVSLLLAVMESSNAVALTGNRLAGFQTASLPLLIVMILIILICRMNDFMLKQRAKEFASYLLMGMERRMLTAMFLCEFWIMGACCFMIGTALGVGVSGFIFMTTNLSNGTQSVVWIPIWGHSVVHSFFYFCLTEGVCSFFIGRRLRKMQISDLLQEEKRNEEFRNIGGYRKWGVVFGVSLICFLGGMLCIMFLPGKMGTPLLSVIALPLLFTVFSGYRFLFSFLCRVRETRAGFLYRKNRLYPMSWMLSKPGTDALLCAVFSICLLISAAAFQFGVLLFQPGVQLYERKSQEWMGFLQICLCILFFAVCFSVQSLLLLTEIRQEAEDLKILYYMGRSREQIKGMLQRQIALRLAMPMGMAGPLLVFCTTLVNWKLKELLPDITENILLKSAGAYSLCTPCFYLLYFVVVCRMAHCGKFAKKRYL